MEKRTHEGFRNYACGALTLFTREGALEEIATPLREHTRGGRHAFAMLFFSKSAFAPQTVIAFMAENAPGLQYSACTTAGEITPDGLVAGELQIILFPASHFAITHCHVGGRDENKIESISAKVGKLKKQARQRGVPASAGSLFALCFMDGLSFREEVITAALHWALDDIPLLGGSSGDDMNFAETCLILNGEILNSSAIVLMVQTSLPVEIFKTENFVPTGDKLVVTASDPDKRIVHEFNGDLASTVYAEIIGADPATLTPQSFASHPLVVRVGGQYYCRSIQRVNEDGSLSFFCAIDDGIVLTVAQPTGMGQTTLEAMNTVQKRLGEIDFILGFDCVLRQIDARNRQITRKMSEIFRQNHVIGFNTYGEQYQSMHLNQTFTGIAFGRADGLARLDESFLADGMGATGGQLE